MYRNTTDFYILTLYPITLLNLFLSSTFFVRVLEFFTFKIMSSAKRNHFTSFFPISITLIYSSCLLALVITSTTMLARSGKSKHPYLLPDLRTKAFSLLPLGIMSSMFFIYNLYHVEVVFFYCSLLSVLFMKGYSNLSKYFPTPIKMIMCFSSFILLKRCIILTTIVCCTILAFQE